MTDPVTDGAFEVYREVRINPRLKPLIGPAVVLFVLNVAIYAAHRWIYH